MKTPKQSASELAENCAIKIVEHYRVGIAYEIGSSNKDSAIFVIRHHILQQLNLTDLIRKAQEVDYYKAHPGIERNDEKGYLTDWKNVAQSAQHERDQLKAQNAELMKCVSFFASVIKSGESWTEKCEQAITAAMSRQEVIK